MKKLILTIAIAAVGFTAAYAQDSAKKVRSAMPKMTIEQRAERSTAMLDKKLNLSADQKTKVYAIQLEKAKKMEALHKDRKETAKLKNETRAAELKTANDKLQNVLNPEQKEKLATIKTGAKEKNRHHKDSKKREFKHKKTDEAKASSEK